MNFQRLLRSSTSAMSSSTANVSPFTRAVVGAMRKLYPEKLADSSFDNTGLLLEAPYRPNHLNNSVLLTIDLTKAVADEAIARKDSVIVTYHPIIFRPLKSITQANSQQSTLLRLAQEGISVYSPHTAVDAAPGGLNDWLVDVLTTDADAQPGGGPIPAYDQSVINPIKDPPPGFEEAGYGRILRFSEPQDLLSLVQRAIQNLKAEGQLEGVSVATPQLIPVGKRGDIKITTVGICAGSGGSMLNGLDVDLLFTGELSHHEALAATEQGRCVMTVFHSNSERGFLASRLQLLLSTQVKVEIDDMERDGRWEQGLDRDFKIGLSEADRDPFEVMTWKNMKEW